MNVLAYVVRTRASTYQRCRKISRSRYETDWANSMRDLVLGIKSFHGQ